jgi:peroxiredoxin
MKRAVHQATSRRRACLGLLAVMLAWPGASAAVEAGAPAPELTAPLLGEGHAAAQLERLRGQVVYVDFWASWCVPCRQSMPALDALYRRHHGAGFTVIGVNKDVALADARRFLDRVPVSFPLVSDGKDALARAFDVRAMPSGYLVDRAGIVRFVHRGFTEASAAELESRVTALLREPQR